MRPPNDPGDNSPGPATKPGRWRALATAMLLVGSLLPAFVARPVLAQSTPFDLNGDVRSTNSGGIDWVDLFDVSNGNATPKALSDHQYAITFQADYGNPDGTYFVTSAKDDDPLSGKGGWQCGAAQNPLAKDDLLNAYGTIVLDTSTNKLVAYLGSERGSDNGSSYAGFWLFKTRVKCDPTTGTFINAQTNLPASHTNGDLLVVSDYTNGGGKNDITVWEWNGTGLTNIATGGVCPGNTLTPTLPCAIGNTKTIAVPWKPGNTAAPSGSPTGWYGLMPQTFVEAGVDLTTLFAPAVVPCFGNFQGETRTAPELTAAQLKDFAGGRLASCFTPNVTTTLKDSANHTGNPLAVAPGTAVTDTANFTGFNDGPVAGTVTFTVYTNDTCTTKADASLQPNPATYNVTGTAPTGTAGPTSAVTFSTPGKYYWQAVYSGVLNASSRYEGATSACKDEQLNVLQAPTVKTTPTTASGPVTSIVLGTTVWDSVQVSGSSGTPTGTVTFYTCTGTTGCGTGGTQLGSAVTLDSTGKARSADFPIAAIGSYCFKAVYNGDTTYATGLDNSSGECFTVTQADSKTKTTPQNADISYPGSNLDSATITGVAGGPGFDGTVNFYICGPQATATGCSANDTTKTAVGTGISLKGKTPTYDSNNVPSVTVQSTSYSSFVPNGFYCFRAEFSGDSNYKDSSDGAVTECFGIGKATAGLTTTPVDPTSHDAVTQIALGQSVVDKAVLSGNNGAFQTKGTVTFTICGPEASGSCPDVTPSGWTPVNVTPGTGSTATAYSPAFTPTATGTYCFAGQYSGDDHYGTASDTRSSECFSVGKATPTVKTTPLAEGKPPTIQLGGTIADSVQVTGVGGTTPTGTVQFFICTPDQTSGGTGCATGTLLPRPADNSDVLSGTGNTATAQSSSYTPLTTGTYCFRAHYPGDNNYSDGSDGSAGECFVVAPGPITFYTTPTGGTIGGTAADTATFSWPSGLPTPTGSVTFYSCGVSATPTACDPGAQNQLGTPVSVTGTPSTSNGTSTLTVAANATITPQQAGWYCFAATYNPPASGGSYLTQTDNNTSRECLSVGLATPGIKTTPTSSSVPLGGTNTDGVVVTPVAGGPTPTGDVYFYICGPLTSAAGCPRPEGFEPLTTDPHATLDASGKATSPAFGPFNQAGWYCFRGEYRDDPAYSTAIDASSGECFQVYIPNTPPNPTPTITTTPNPKAGVVGTAIADSANLTGGNGNPGGTISFYLYGPGDTSCATDLLANSPTFKGITVSNKSAGSPTYTTSKIGVYQWVASYSGDGSNNGTRGLCGDVTEQVAINAAPAAPSTITTAPNPGPGTPVTVGTAIKDVANVTGNSPTGTVNFRLYGPGDTSCTTNLLSGKTGFTNITLSGGSATSPAYTTDKIGVYQWVATYSGDANNQPSSGACGDTTEQVTTGAVLAEIVTGANDLALAVLGLPFLAAGLSLLLLVARRREQNG